LTFASLAKNRSKLLKREELCGKQSRSSRKRMKMKTTGTSVATNDTRPKNTSSLFSTT
jgi:hypothetical protein